MVNDDVSFPSEWEEFFSLVRDILYQKDQQPTREYVRALHGYRQVVFSTLKATDFNRRFRERWVEFVSQEENTQTAHLLKIEVQSVTAMLREGLEDLWARARPRIRLRDLLSAARVVVDSLIDLLGDVLGMIVKGPLTVFSELLEIYEAA